MNKKNKNLKKYTFNEFKKEFLTPNTQQTDENSNALYQLGVKIAKQSINKTQIKFSVSNDTD